MATMSTSLHMNPSSGTDMSSEKTMGLFTISDMFKKLGVVPSDASFKVPSSKLEYLLEEEHGNNGPSFGSRLCYGAGFTHLSGLAIGGTWGLFEGLAHPEAKSRRMRVNAVLNSCTKRGPFLANNMGLIAVMYNFIQFGFVKATGRDYDIYSSLGSAVTAGYLFRASSGPRTALMSSFMCASVMTAVELYQNWSTHSRRFQSFIISLDR